MTCVCGEEFAVGDALAPTMLPMHRECGLREVLGGIGHLIDHEHYCLVRHDPDAGLTYRDSARMVATWVELQGGIEAALGE